MKIIALDSATSYLVVGLAELIPLTNSHSDSIEILAEKIIPTNINHNEILIPTIQSIMKTTGLSIKQIEAIVVGEGPGPYTGLRVGVTTALTLADGLNIPIFGVNTLDALATAAYINLPEDIKINQNSIITVVTNAKRNELFWAQYQNQKRINNLKVNSPNEIDLNSSSALVGEEIALTKIDFPKKSIIQLDSTSLITVAKTNIAAKKYHKVNAQYLRKPDVKIQTSKYETKP